jgi:hypothetical protein
MSPDAAKATVMSVVKEGLGSDRVDHQTWRVSLLDLERQTKVDLIDVDRMKSNGPPWTTFSRDGNVVADEHGRVWDATTGTARGAFVPKATKQNDVSAAQLSGDGSHVLVWGHGDRWSWFEVASHREISNGVAKNARAALSDDGKVLVIGMEDGGLEVHRGTDVMRGASDGGAARAVAVDAQRGLAATLGDDGAIRIWDLVTARLRVALAEFADGEHVAFSPGGAYAGTSEVAERIGWMFQSPPEPFRFEQFAAHYHKPEVVLARLAGKDVDVPSTPPRPPSVEILDHPAEVNATLARVRVRARSEGRVEKVLAFVEGRPARAARVCAREGTAELEIPVTAGTNRITLTAFDELGFSSNAASVDVKSTASTAKPALWAVTVGIASYPRLLDLVKMSDAARAAARDRARLPAAPRDATALADALQGLAGTGKQYGEAHVATLVDEGKPVTPDDIRRALQTLERMASTDVAFVLLAGHGFKPSQTADMVFVTSGTQLAEDGVTLTAESLARDVIAWKDIEAALARARGRVVVLLDACHSGHVQQSLTPPSDALASALVKSKRAGAIVFAASKGREVSFEPDAARALTLETKRVRGGTHGYFTGAWLDTLADPTTDVDGDGSLELDEIVNAVTLRVRQASGDLQHPWVARRELFGDFAIAPTPR